MSALVAQVELVFSQSQRGGSETGCLASAETQTQIGTLGALDLDLNPVFLSTSLSMLRRNTQHPKLKGKRFICLHFWRVQSIISWVAEGQQIEVVENRKSNKGSCRDVTEEK